MTLNRREFVKVAGAGAAAVALPGLLARCTSGPRPRTEDKVTTGAADLADYFESQFGITRALMQEVLGTGMGKGGDYCDLFFQHQRSTYVGLEDGAVNRGSASVILGVGVRVLRGDQTGYAYTETLDRHSMLEAAQAAAAIADGPAGAAPSSLKVQPHVELYPARTWWTEVSVEQRVPLLMQLNERSFGHDLRVTKVRASLSDEDSVILVADSLGHVSADRQPMVVLRLSVSAEDKGRVEENSDSFAGRQGLEVLDSALLDRVARTAVERAQRNFEARKPPAGELPVVLNAGSSGILLHEAIGHGMEADFNRKGTSIYADMVGKPIAEPFVSIVDDGTVAHSRGAINVDDEGCATQRTVLVDKGVLRTFMHDRISAQHYSLDPTGNGRRQSFHHAPLPRMRATYMLDGPHARDEIISSVKRGVICETFTNGEVNIGPGDFTFYVKNGYLIEDGKVTAPVKDFNIIGNGPEVLRNVTMVANDMTMDDGSWTCGKSGQRVPVSLGMPTCLVSSITVGGVDGE